MIKIFFLILLSFSCVVLGGSESPLKVGSKKFTESTILSELITQKLKYAGIETKHIAEFGGTSVLWNALLSGDIDIYPEYTSTIEKELLKSEQENFSSLQQSLGRIGIGITAPLGFNNTYALGMRKVRATQLGLEKISDLSRFPEIKMGFSEEFLQRQDGWLGLKDVYHLSHESIRGLDHDIAYRALQSNDIELLDLYSTDAEIQYYDLQILKDDLSYFPHYDAVYLYRLDSARQHPAILKILNQFANKISEKEMILMNRHAKIDKQTSADVAAKFLKDNFSIDSQQKNLNLFQRVDLRARQHLKLVLFSLFFSTLIAIPLGIIAAKFSTFGRIILAITGTIQTIPALALLVMLIKPLNIIGLAGIGDTPAFFALFLYSLLPIVRGAHTGIQQIPLAYRETSELIGLSFWTKILKIEIPLALPSILSGVKTAAVINVGFATLGALVGAGGFGQPILAGIRLDDYSLILEGAIPSAILALVVQMICDLLERYLISPGLAK